jgi:hypothetical protein
MKFQQFSVCLALMVGAVSTLSTAPAQASNFFGNGTFSFASNQTYDFQFLLSKGMWQSDFGVYNVTTKQFTKLFSEQSPGYDPYVGTKRNGDDSSRPFDWLGTCGTTVLSCTNSFTFLANNTYQFFLTGKTTQFSSTPGNTAFTYNGGAYTFNSSGPTYNATKTPILATVNAPAGEGAALIAMNDTHAIDVDKNDFIVSAKPASTSVPEPATLMGLGVVTSGFLSLRRRKAAQAVKA